MATMELFGLGLAEVASVASIAVVVFGKPSANIPLTVTLD